jgi:hypothetical protein
MNSGLKLRWRILTRDELLYHDGSGAVLVRKDEHEIVSCVLEFMTDGQAVKDFWGPVPVERVTSIPQRGVE